MHTGINNGIESRNSHAKLEFAGIKGCIMEEKGGNVRRKKPELSCIQGLTME